MRDQPFSLDVLEFPAVIDMLRPFLSGPVSRYLLETLQPGAERGPIEEELERVAEARDCLASGTRPSLAGLEDIRPILDKAQVEGVTCAPLEILRALEVARAARDTRPFFQKTAWPRLDQMTSGLPPFRELLAALDGKILPDGSLDSSASPRLAALRRSIERLRSELQATLERLVQSLARDKLVQDAVVTLRNDRFVIPVKAAEKRRVDGIVHGSSSSGASVFIEPLPTVPLNNELVELQDQEAEEVRRILREFTARLGAQREELRTAAEILARLDLVFAKAEFARRYDGCIPRFSDPGASAAAESRGLQLVGLRHPLLIKALGARRRSPVPFSLELRPSRTMMVISGPNTGGKTATLKSIGMAALMAQSGMPVTAREACLPLFARVLADIGDRQSMEQDLSTFSAHLESIRSIMNQAGPADLVLLDELGGSTDPKEGEALAVALLERFAQLGPITIATTHFSALKAFAASSDRALNAAMDFDDVTLRPTYRLIVGLPGKSSGLDVARRLGLDPEIVDRAQAMLDPAFLEASSLLDFLHSHEEQVQRELERARQQQQELAARKVELESQYQEERRVRLKELDQRWAEALRRQEKQWQSALEEIRRQALAEGKQPGKAGLRAQRQGRELAREGREVWNEHVLEVLGGPDERAPQTAPEGLEIGDQVRVAGFPTAGTVMGLPDASHAELEVGRIRMRVDRDKLQVTARGRPLPVSREAATMPSAGERFANSSRDDTPPASPAPAAEINVIGATTEEALERVDKFLDESYLAGHLRLRVIHGYGKGILRKNLQQMFASHPHVEKFYPAAPRDGGAGATMVELKA